MRLFRKIYEASLLKYHKAHGGQVGYKPGSKIYHLNGTCFPNVDGWDDVKIISREKAEKLGLRLCKNCAKWEEYYKGEFYW